MKQKYLFLSVFTILAFFGYVAFASAQASNNDIPVGVQYNADGTCVITLPGSVTNGTTVVNENGEQSCLVENPTEEDQVNPPIIEDVDEVFDEVFPPEPPSGDRIIIPPPVSPTPYVLFYVNDGATRVALPPGASTTVYWQVENIVENTCRGTSSGPVSGWPSTTRQPYTPMIPEVSVTFSRIVGSFPVAGTYVLTLTGCRGWDGSFVPDQSVTIIVEDEPAVPDTGTTGDGSTGTTGTTPNINQNIRWNEQ